jgi:methylated-DNA-[protein]-cysteine S-methyltransferase
MELMTHLIGDAATVTTPLGPFSVLAIDDAVVASGWTAEVETLLGHVHPVLRPGEIRSRADLGGITRPVTKYHRALEGAGEPGAEVAEAWSAVRAVPLRLLGSPFFLHAWEVLRSVEPGIPLSYAAYAAKAGRPAAVRAAANACARNPVALFVPCHRVVRTHGALGGFGWGLPAKEWLLQREAASVVGLAPAG